jgi:thiol:disulfide interchange protein DsbA
MEWPMRISAVEKLVVLGAAIGLSGIVQAQSDPFRDGEHYQAYEEPQETLSGPDAIEVAEVFMYSCIHCYRFEPQLERWLAAKADYVEFIRIPAIFNEWAALLARAHYTAIELGKLDEMHIEFFREIHDRQNLLNSQGAMQEFFARFGVDTEEFDSVFTSDAVTAKVEKALELNRAYRIPETPSIVVNGKYLSLGGMAGSYDTWFEIINYLAAKERVAH